MLRDILVISHYSTDRRGFVLQLKRYQCHIIKDKTKSNFLTAQPKSSLLSFEITTCDKITT